MIKQQLRKIHLGGGKIKSPASSSFEHDLQWPSELNEGEFVKKPTGTWKVHHRIAYPSSAELQSLKLMEETFFWNPALCHPGKGPNHNQMAKYETCLDSFRLGKKKSLTG